MNRIDQGPYTVKNVKTFRGREGMGTNCSLYRDGKKIALVDDPATGALYWNFHFVTEDRRQQKEDLEEFAKKSLRSAKGKVYLGETFKLMTSGDSLSSTFMSCICDISDQDKQLKNQCKTKTLVRLSTDEEGGYHIWNCVFSPKNKERVRDAIFNHHGEVKIEWINEDYA